jgi:hypothetical protein
MKFVSVLIFLISLAQSSKGQTNSPSFIGKWTITAVIADYNYYNMKIDSLVLTKKTESEYINPTDKQSLKNRLRGMYQNYTVEITTDGTFNFETGIESLNMKGTYKTFPGKPFLQVTSKNEKGQKVVDTMWYELKNGLLYLKSKAKNPDFVFIYERVRY